MQLGNIEVGAPIALAPMAGVTNAPFRRLCREYAQSGLAAARAVKESAVPAPQVDYLAPPASRASRPAQLSAPAGLFVCEMITARALVEGKATTRALLKPDPFEPVRSVQLHGVDPATMRRAAQILAEEGLADHIDMNFGCPVPKVTRKGGGSALPWKTTRFYELVRAAVEGAARSGREVPVTVKVREGIDARHTTMFDALQAAQEAGAAALTLHARTATQYYSGTARWEAVAELVERAAIPVWGNGDVFESENALELMARTGCVGVQVGRGCQGRPWLFYDLAAATSGQPQIKLMPSLGEVVSVINRHAELLVEWMGDEPHALRDMRKHVGWYLRGFPVGGDLRGTLTRVESLAQLADLLSTLPLDAPFPVAATGKRGRAGHERKTHLPHNWLLSREVDEDALKVLANAELDTTLDEGGY